MKTYLDCFPCMLNQALEAARAATPDTARQREILNRVMGLLMELRLDASPPEIARKSHRLVRELSGNPDPYKDQKHEYNERALALLTRLRVQVEQAVDPLDLAVRLSIAGNVIDFGAMASGFDFDREWKNADKARFGISDYEAFKADILKARSILYLGDNAGEIAFDRLLVEVLKQISKAEITFVVRGEPVLNDATLEDARFVGLDRLVPVVDNGTDAPGTVLSEVRPEVRRLFETADVIIAKGQGNYETLNDAPGNIYFLFQIKCPVIGRSAGAEVGKYMLKGSALRGQAKRDTVVT
jgi:uncharacterized protein with ATP-grasp and redox domains